MPRQIAHRLFVAPGVHKEVGRQEKRVHAQSKIAGEPVSRILSKCVARVSEPRIVAIIPLGRDSRHGSSSLPEGCSLLWLAPSQRKRARLRELARRAGPALPSYLALHHAGFSVPRVLPHERWALTPPFHPCQTKRAVRRRLAGFPARCHRAALRRRYILCGTVRDAPHRAGLNPAPHAEACNPASRQTLRGSPPGVTRRVALYPEAALAAEGCSS